MMESVSTSKDDGLREFEESILNISIDSVIGKKKIHFTPVMPSLSKSSPQASLAKYIKSARFMPASIHRPKLLSDINLKIDNDLRKLTQNSDPNSIPIELERLGIFQKAFQTYIDDTVLYKTILERIKEEYDNVIESFKMKLESSSSLESLLKEKDASYEISIEVIKQGCQNEVKDLELKIKSMEELMLKSRREKVQAEMDSLKHASEAKHFQIEYNNLRSTSIAIAASLTRSEDSLFKAQQMMVEKDKEVNESRAAAMRMGEEINNLQLSIHALKSTQTTAASVDHTNQLESTVQVLRDEGVRLDQTHRQLLVRYAMLKSAVDAAFDKWNSITLGQAGSNNVLLLEQKVKALVAPLTKDDDSFFEDKKETKTDAAEKLIRMMEDGANPRIVLDSLLDHLEINKAVNIASMGIRMEDGSMSLEGAYAGSPIFSRLGTAKKDNNAGADEFNLESVEQFEGKGFGNEVPIYLRHDGKVQNISLSHRDAVKLINEIWEAKEQFDKEESSPAYTAAMTPFTLVPTSPQPIPPSHSTGQGGGGGGGGGGATNPLTVKIDETAAQRGKLSPRKLNSRTKSNRKSKNTPAKKPGTAKIERPKNPDMATFLNYYLHTKYRRDFAIQIAYALHDALMRYARLSDFKLFQMVLDQQVNQAVWQDQSMLIDELYNALVDEDSSKIGDGKKGKGWGFKNVIFDEGGDDLVKKDWRLTLDEILRITKRVLKKKSVNNFLELARSLQLDAGGCKFLDPSWLLTEDPFGLRSNFLETLKIIHINDSVAQEQRTLQSIDKFAASAAASAAAAAAAAAATSSAAAPHGIAAHPPHMKANPNSKPNNGRIHMNSAERGRRKGAERNRALENQADMSTAAAAVAADIEMTVGKFRDALMEALPDWSRQEISHLLCRGCDCSLEDALLMEAKRSTVSVEAFKTRLKTKLITQTNLIVP